MDENQPRTHVSSMWYGVWSMEYGDGGGFKSEGNSFFMFSVFVPRLNVNLSNNYSFWIYVTLRTESYHFHRHRRSFVRSLLNFSNASNVNCVRTFSFSSFSGKHILHVRNGILVFRNGIRFGWHNVYSVQCTLYSVLFFKRNRVLFAFD